MSAFGLHTARNSCFSTSVREHQRRRSVKPPSALLEGLFGRTAAPLENQLPSVTLDWLRAKGLPPQKLTARDVGAEGRGLVANSRLREGEPLLQVPRGLVLTAEDALQQSQLAALIERTQLPAWSVLALFLVENRFGVERPWQPYVSVLPQTCNCILEWPESQVERLLTGMQMLDDAREIRAAADASWQQLQPILAEPAAVTAFGGRRPARADLQWAFSMLLSRLIRLSSMRDAEALVPWADLLNHSPDAESCIDWDPSMQAVVLRQGASAAANQQVYCSYGEKSSAQLLQIYGFVPDGVNRHESVAMRLALSEADPLFGKKAAALAACGLQHGQSFPLRLGAFPDGLVLFAAILAAGDAEAVQNAWSARKDGREERLTAANRVAALNLIRQRCKDSIAALSAAPGVPAAQPASPRQSIEQLVAEVRTRELRVLNRASFLLLQDVRELSRLSV